MQNGGIVFWAPVCHESDLMESVEFLIIGTGMTFPDEDYRYIGTVQDGSLVWHVFQSADEKEGESSE